jgi:hypothetical protein
MATLPVEVRPALRTQPDLIGRREHCSADVRVLAPLGISIGEQVRVRRDKHHYALYTVSESRTERAGNVIRMGLTGRHRLNTHERFAARLDARVVHPAITDEEAELRGEFLERLDDDGHQARFVVIAPHGGDIEIRTDDQASGSHAAWQTCG